ncbi:histone-like nucleoid-structuring protein Lsr2 [Rhodococcus sp. SGAir0479]|uniref:histone-like nucleoid-structuring protein Lsr2 n=1 Tax=Rhodococcus sp. SGAir0479 TaxID=2567884 RepID=UPI0010CD0413|nr:Lsr2 family protein [Rhodococcus sp. SGAir0479]QCQ93291.1 Lsr2 family protein [Rhodococcus sp. SGAir0479]
MAQKVIVELIDDLDGEPIDVGGETISFAVGGVEYTIDLNDKNATEFHRKMDYYIRHATKVGGRQTARAATKAASDGASTQEIREWASANGYSVSTRGRIASDIVKAYAAAH